MNHSSIILRKAIQVCEVSELGQSTTLFGILRDLTKQQAKICVNLAPNGTTPLLAAIKYNHLQIVKHLIERYGAYVDGRGKVSIRKLVHSDVTPIWYASHAGYTDLVEYLLENNAEINSLNTYASTPLYAACFIGAVEVVRVLLKGGADVDMPTVFGDTSLLLASRMGHRKTVEALLDYGADVNQTNPDGRTALHESSAEGKLHVVKLLLSKGAWNKPDKNGITPHLAAAISSYNEVVCYYDKCDNVSSLEERIQALQILGASIVAQDGNLYKAVFVWKQAIQLSIDNGIATKHNTSEVRKLLGKRELRTTVELDKVAEDQDTVEMRVQAVLICDRILGLHTESNTTCRYSNLTTKVAWDAGLVYAMGLDIRKAHRLWYLAIATRSRNSNRLTSSVVEWMEKAVEITEQIRLYGKSIIWQSSVEDSAKTFDIAIYELRREKRCLRNQRPTFPEHIAECKERLERLTLIVAKLMALICIYVPNMVDDNLIIETKVRQLAELDPKGPNGQTLLQLVSTKDTNQLGNPPVDLFPSVKCMSILSRVENPANS